MLDSEFLKLYWVVTHLHLLALWFYGQRNSPFFWPWKTNLNQCLDADLGLRTRFGLSGLKRHKEVEDWIPILFIVSKLFCSPKHSKPMAYFCSGGLRSSLMWFISKRVPQVFKLPGILMVKWLRHHTRQKYVFVIAFEKWGLLLLPRRTRWSNIYSKLYAHDLIEGQLHWWVEDNATVRNVRARAWLAFSSVLSPSDQQ